MPEGNQAHAAFVTAYTGPCLVAQHLLAVIIRGLDEGWRISTFTALTAYLPYTTTISMIGTC